MAARPFRQRSETPGPARVVALAVTWLTTASVCWAFFGLFRLVTEPIGVKSLTPTSIVVYDKSSLSVPRDRCSFSSCCETGQSGHGGGMGAGGGVV